MVLVVVLGLSGHPWALLGLVGVVPAVSAVRAVIGGAKGRDLIAVLGATGRVQLVVGLLAALGLTLSR